MKSKLIGILLVLSTNAYSHGMNSSGPHKGNITMPGAYHVELVNKQNNIIVYLLDINFKDPLTKNSEVEVQIENQSKKKCTPVKDYFDCGIISKNDKKISIFSTRNKSKGSEAKYSLPLKY